MRAVKIIKISIISLLVFASNVYAEGVDLEVDWPSSPAGTQLTGEATIDQLVLYLFEWAMAVGAVLLFGSLVYASFHYIVSSGDPNKLSGAKRKVGAAFGGFALLLASWMLLSVLDPELAIISEVGTTERQMEEDAAAIADQISEIEEENRLCDYALVDYLDQAEAAVEEKDRITLLFRKDLKSQMLKPHSSIACKSEQNMEEDALDGTIKFIEAEPVSRHETGYKPDCEEKLNCQQGGFGEGQVCHAVFGEGEPLKEEEIQYCYTERQFPVGIGYRPGRTAYLTGTVMFISQKEKRSLSTTCLAGDKKLEDGGGCALGLYKDDKASRCTEMITPVSATTPNIRVSGYDHQISCIEIYAEEEEEDESFGRLKIEIKGEGETDPPEGSHFFEPITTVHLEANPDPGWKLKKWSGYGTSSDKIFSFRMPNRDLTVTAEFEEEDSQ